MSKRVSRRSSRATQSRPMPGRRRFIEMSGALLGSAVLSGPLQVARAAGITGRDGLASAGRDLIWGEHGAAERIAASLAHVSKALFRRREYDVTAFGARPCTV